MANIVMTLHSYGPYRYNKDYKHKMKLRRIGFTAFIQGLADIPALALGAVALALPTRTALVVQGTSRLSTYAKRSKPSGENFEMKYGFKEWGNRFLHKYAKSPTRRHNFTGP